jgi:hypothetical protein
MSSIAKNWTFRGLTRTRAILAISTVLIVFGALDALGTHHATSGSPPDTSAMAPNRATVRPEQSAHRAPVRQSAAQQMAAKQNAAQRVAIQNVAARFVIACDTTDPAQPQGDQATEAALAPGLVPHNVVEPAATSTEDRATTVTLDASGQPVPGRHGTVAVIVTGTMSVTSDTSPPQRVPIVAKVTLRPRTSVPTTGGQPETASDVSGWQVVGVEVGA